MRSLGWALYTAPAVHVGHAALGLLVALTAIGLLVQAIRLRRRQLVTAATLGALFVVGAGFNGQSFLDYHMSLSSLIMALLFALAMLCYLAIVYAVLLQ